MNRGTQQLRILEEDMGADAITFENYEEGVTYLFVRPGQSFESAVKGILKVCPEMSLPRVQDLVRTHCPNVIEMNERLGADQVVPRFEAAPDAGVVPPVQVKPLGQHRRPRPPRWAKVAAVAAPALAGGMLLAQWLTPSPKGASTTTAAPSISHDDKVAAGTYRNPSFEKIAEGGEMKCDPMGAYEAKCVDADGKVMYSEASVGTSTAFTFSYDLEKVGFRLFSDADSAAAWAAEEANQDLYPKLRQYGRVVLWGTDGARLREWGNALAEQERQLRAQPQAASAGRPSMAPMMVSTSAGPLPDRLAFLAFGTLGVTEKAIEQAVQSDDTQSVQLLRAVELVLGDADSSHLGIVPAGSNDAVAVVVDAPTQPRGDGTELNGGARPTPVDTAPTDTAPPAAKPEAEPEPVAEEPQPEPEQPAAEEPQPAPEPEPVAEEPAAAPAPAEPAATEPENAHDPAQGDPQPEHGNEPEHAPGNEAPPAETTPAPPVTEEPVGDGLSLEAMPTAWAA